MRPYPTFLQLHEFLDSMDMFTAAEAALVVRTAGNTTLGAVMAACGLLEIVLTEQDKVMLRSAYNHQLG
jgi:hypothetical protein